MLNKRKELFISTCVINLTGNVSLAIQEQFAAAVAAPFGINLKGSLVEEWKWLLYVCSKQK
ncbi:hypothetical protein [Paenibacillus ferrarius]|uniref:hypothetical protein n=1 Tax=Paenibacillus ferrarius TaxID=1469647 RepID=UPI00117F8571|nr:hypothetical protein [Paenibacillus ferrarius]